MKIWIFVVLLLVAVPFIASAQLYPYHETETSVLYYLENTQENRSFWFVYSENNDRWGVDWDKERLPFKKVMIHHTGGEMDQLPEEMEEVSKMKYIARYASDDNDPYVKGLEPQSSHVINGKETFLPYHFLIYQNGEIINCLSPLTYQNNTWYIDNVAWHAGNWIFNCESLSIGLVGNFGSDYPSDEQLKSLSKLINFLRKYNPNLEVFPHRTLEGKTSKYPIWGKYL